MQAYKDYRGFNGMNYVDVVRIESRIGAENLGKLNNNFASTPGLANAFENDLGLINGWEALQNTSFRGEIE